MTWDGRKSSADKTIVLGVFWCSNFVQSSLQDGNREKERPELFQEQFFDGQVNDRIKQESKKECFSSCSRERERKKEREFTIRE